VKFPSPFESLDMERSNALVDSVLLPRWTARNWDNLLEYTETQLVSPGDIVLQKGSEKRMLYIVAFGKLHLVGERQKKPKILWVRHRNPIHQTIIESGSVFGELSFLDNGPHPITVQAITNCQLQYLSDHAFTLFCAHHPDLGIEILFDLGRIISLQMRHITTLLAQFKEQ
jgi:CRP-like cAMP-binding protein